MPKDKANLPKEPEATGSERSYRGATPEERRLRRRDQLINAGIKVYGEQGYRNSSIKAVCETAGLTERYFYESFSNSDELLAACFNRVTDAVYDVAAQARDAVVGDSTERARAMLNAYFAALQRDRARARVFLVEVRGAGPIVDSAFQTAVRSIGQRVANSLTPTGNTSDKLLQIGVVGGVIEIASSWVANNYAPPIDVVTDTALRLCLVLAQD